MAGVFYVARHGLTKDDVPGREKVTGWLEVPLNAEGRQNAHKAGRLLKSKGITGIYASDLKRTAQTAAIIGECIGVPVVESEKLRSWNMGSMQGMLSGAAKPFLAYFQKHPSLRPPDGEPFVRFYNRFKAIWDFTVAHVKRFPESHPLLVTHSQNIDITDWFIRGIAPGNALEFGDGIEAGGVCEVRVSDDGKIRIRHLRG